MFVLSTGYVGVSSALALEGTKCSKIGQKRSVAGQSFNCVRDGKRGLRWKSASGSKTVSTTSTTPGVSCAQGGPCRVGDRGPGGGIIYLVVTTPFACGPRLEGSCTTLEAAPERWQLDASVNLPDTGDPLRNWAARSNSYVSVAGVGAGRIEFGTGYANSLAIAAQSGNSSLDTAAVLALSYKGGSKSDWYLPARDELDYLQRRISNTLGGFSSDFYWTSTESHQVSGEQVNFLSGGARSRGKNTRLGDDNSFTFARVRPIRSF